MGTLGCTLGAHGGGQSCQWGAQSLPESTWEELVSELVSEQEGLREEGFRLGLEEFDKQRRESISGMESGV